MEGEHDKGVVFIIDFDPVLLLPILGIIGFFGVDETNFVRQELSLVRLLIDGLLQFHFFGVLGLRLAGSSLCSL